MQQLNLKSQTKEEETVAFIQEHEPPEGYFLGFSGGKDSVLLYDLTMKSGVKFSAFYSDTGIDPPEVVKFIREQYPDVKFERPLLTLRRHFPLWPGTRSFFGMVEVTGFPCRTSRWCCNILKKEPTRNIPLPHRLLGIRAEESYKRAERGRISYHRKYKQWLYKPIFHWLTWEVWDYIETNNLSYCSLYDEGFDRIGCVVCPFLCHGIRGDLKRHMDRWPKHYKAFEKAMRRLFDNYLCVVNPRSGAWNFRRETDFQTFLNNWYRGV